MENERERTTFGSRFDQCRLLRRTIASTAHLLAHADATVKSLLATRIRCLSQVRVNPPQYTCRHLVKTTRLCELEVSLLSTATRLELTRA